MEVPLRLRYAKEEEAERITTHEVKKQWCKDEEEWTYVKGVQEVLRSVEWKKTEDEEGGITWIELYALYTIHKGRAIEKKLDEEDPMRKPQMMQMQLAAFREAVRKIKKHSIRESEEWQFDTSYAPKNRLKKAAVENKQAAVKGLPCLNEEDAVKIMRMILALRGVNRKKQIDAWLQGGLHITPQRLKLQSMATGWNKVAINPSDTLESDGRAHIEGSPRGTEADEVIEVRESLKKELQLKSIACPKCGKQQDPMRMKLVTKAGFSNLQCKACGQKTLSSLWRCRCQKLWMKCDIHVHDKGCTSRKSKNASPKIRKGSKVDYRGRDAPLPVRRARKARVSTAETPPCQTFFTQLEIDTAVRGIRLERGSKLAAKSPHLVKAAAPT